MLKRELSPRAFQWYALYPVILMSVHPEDVWSKRSHVYRFGWVSLQQGYLIGYLDLGRSLLVSVAIESETKMPLNSYNLLIHITSESKDT